MDIGNCPAAQVADQCADDTHANDRDAIATFGAGIPYGVECGLHVGREYRTGGRQALGQRNRRADGNDQTGLMRVERKDNATAQFPRPGLDPPNNRIAVFDRERESASHERSAHAVEFAFRDPAGKYQAFSAAAEPAMQRAHAN